MYLQTAKSFMIILAMAICCNNPISFLLINYKLTLKGLSIFIYLSFSCPTDHYGIAQKDTN